MPIESISSRRARIALVVIVSTFRRILSRYQPVKPLQMLSKFPMFIEKARRCNHAWRARGDWFGNVDDRVVRKFGDLARVVEVVVFAKSEAAVQYDVMVGIERVGEDKNGNMRIGRKAFVAQFDFILRPFDWKFVGDFGEDLV